MKTVLFRWLYGLVANYFVDDPWEGGSWLVKVAVARGVLTGRTRHSDMDTNSLLISRMSLMLTGSVANPPTVGRFRGVNGPMFSGGGVTLIPSRFSPYGSVGSTAVYGHVHSFTHGRRVGGCFRMNRVNVRRTLLPSGNLITPNRVVVNTSSRAYACNTLGTLDANVNRASVNYTVTDNAS